MNTSAIYHCLERTDQELLSTTYKSDEVHIKVRTKKEKLRCSSCKRLHVIKSGSKERIIRGPLIGKLFSYIHIKVQRLECKSSGCIRQENLSFLKPKKSYINGLKRFVLYLSQEMTITAISYLIKGTRWLLLKNKENLGPEKDEPKK